MGLLQKPSQPTYCLFGETFLRTALDPAPRQLSFWRGQEELFGQTQRPLRKMQLCSHFPPPPISPRREQGPRVPLAGKEKLCPVDVHLGHATMFNTYLLVDLVPRTIGLD